MSLRAGAGIESLTLLPVCSLCFVPMSEHMKRQLPASAALLSTAARPPRQQDAYHGGTMSTCTHTHTSTQKDPMLC